MVFSRAPRARALERLLVLGPFPGPAAGTPYFGCASSSANASRAMRNESIPAGTPQYVATCAGYTPHVYDAGVDELWTIDPLKTDLLIVLGGPFGAYEDDRYPFVAEELRILEARLAAADRRWASAWAPN